MLEYLATYSVLFVLALPLIVAVVLYEQHRKYLAQACMVNKQADEGDAETNTSNTVVSPKKVSFYKYVVIWFLGPGLLGIGGLPGVIPLGKSFCLTFAAFGIAAYISGEVIRSALLVEPQSSIVILFALAVGLLIGVYALGQTVFYIDGERIGVVGAMKLVLFIGLILIIVTWILVAIGAIAYIVVR